MLPTPAKVTSARAGSITAMPTAAPRVGRSASCIAARSVAGPSAGRAWKTRMAAPAALAASPPWPSPSARTTVVRPARSSTAQASPQTSSPGLATDRPQTRVRPFGRRAWGAGQSVTSTVPPPGREYTSKTSDRRRMPPSPIPAPPLVEKPSRSDSGWSPGP